MTLPSGWRKFSLAERRAYLAERFASARTFFSGSGYCEDETADLMIENAIGYYPVPLGIVQGLVVDGVEYAVPVATEEASVVAAASFAARVIASSGGFATSATAPVMTVQIFVPAQGQDLAERLEEHRDELVSAASASLASMTERGGGFRFMEISPVQDAPFVRVELGVDVRDAMGANLLNACGEATAAAIGRLIGTKPLMSIVSNGASFRRARSGFSLPFEALARAGRGAGGRDLAERIVAAGLVASRDRERAITHNKGVMNGITGLALATGNDSRAVEAAAHAWASRGGSYQPLTIYRTEGEVLRGELEIPVPFAVVGGGVGVNPGSAFALDLLGKPDAQLLGRIAAALGLAQNFAALLALTTEGIQRGHMRLHDRRRELSP